MATFTILNNDGTIALPDVSIVQETVGVYGLQGLVTDVSVQLNNLTHTYPQDLDMLLVGPDGTKNLEFWSDIGPGDPNDLVNASFTISDAGGTPLPAGTVPVNGTTYKPADYDTPGETDSSFNSSTGGINHPFSTGTATFAVFDNLSPNGTWTLYIRDDAGTDFGTLQSWGVTITTNSLDVAIGGTGGDDTLNVIRTGVGSGSYSLNGGQSIAFSGVASLNFDGKGGNDALNITDVSGSGQIYNLGGDTISFGDANTHVTYVSTETVTLNTGAGADTFKINRTTDRATSFFSGAGNDTFIFANGAGLNGGSIDGGADTDTLDFLAFTSSFGVNLGLGTTGLSGTLEADQEVPGTASVASGTVSVGNYNALTKTFDIQVTVTGIAPADVTSFQVHRAGVGLDGPGIVDLQPLGLLVPTGDGFSFTAAGISLPPLQEAAFLGGFTYLDVATSAFPDGAIRGQLFSNGNVSLASGTWSNPGTLTGIENVFGGRGDDSIVGSFAVNVLEGGYLGNDTILGGPGGDLLRGQSIADGLLTGNDVILWNNGDGNDTIEGGDGTDIVQVNVAGSDLFVHADGQGFDVHDNVGAIDIDIDAVEALSIAGSGGPDQIFARGDLAGVVDLNSINLHGFAGSDTLVGSSLSDTLRGHDGSDTLDGLGGADTLMGGAGDDVIEYTSSESAVAGEIVDGGAGNDQIRIFESNTFTGVTITGVEQLRFSGVDVIAATLLGTQIGAGKITTVDGDSSVTDNLIVNAASDVDLSGVSFTNWENGTDTITINGSAAGENLTGSSQNDTITGGGGADVVNGGSGDDILKYFSGDIASGETIDGGTGTDVIFLAENGVYNFIAIPITRVETLDYALSNTASTAVFLGALNGGLGNIVTVDGSTGTDTLVLNALADVDLSGVTFSNWTSGTDFITIAGTAAGQHLTGSNQNDLIAGVGGVDIMNGGAGDDTFAYANGTDIAAGETIDGGSGTDSILLPSGSYDFTGVSIANVETLTYGNNAGSATATVLGSQIGAGKIATVNGTLTTIQALIVNAASDVDLSGVTFLQWTNGTDTITINGSAAGENLTGSGQNDTINGGGGTDTARFAGGRASYTIARGADVAVTVTGPDGTDTLTNVERLQFDDQIVMTTAANDFNGDGRSDVLFNIPGPNFNSDYMWQMNDRSIASQGAIDLYDKTFNVQVTGDYDGDGKSDVVFQNPTTGGVWMWQLDGTTIKSQGAVDVADPTFHLLGSADFNGDGKDDLLFRNDAGFVYMWQMNGRANTPLPVQALDPVWHVAGAGDFDGDGKADILLHNVSATPDNGAYFLWKMNGNQIIGQGGIERPDATWHTLAVGDFDGDGKSDFAIRNESASGDNGAVWVYLMDGTTIKSQGAAGIVKASEFSTVGVGDYNGDGKDDILFRNAAGFFYSWDMNGKVIASEGAFGTEAGNFADPAFTVVTQHWDLV